jgi:hypothetical protein
MVNRVRRGIDTWATILSMIAPELTRFQARYPRSRRCGILEALAQAAEEQDEHKLIRAGEAFFALTRVVPPGCYARCSTRQQVYLLSGERINGRKRREV